MSRTIHSFLFQISGQICAVVTGVVLARALGPAGKGTVGYAAVVLSLVTVFFNGQGEAIAYQIGRRKLPMRRVAAATLQLLAVVIPPVMLIMIGLGIVLPGEQMFIVAAIALPFALIAQLSVPFFMVLEQITIANTQALTVSVAYLFFALASVLVFHASVPAVLTVWIGSQVLGTVLALTRLHRSLLAHEAVTVQTAQEFVVATAAAASPDAAVAEGEIVAAEVSVVPDDLKTPRDVAVAQFRFTAKSGLAAVAGYLNLRIDVFVVAAMLGTTWLGIYTLAIATGEMMWKVSQAITWTSLGRIASLPPLESAQLVAKVTRHVFSIQFIAGIVIVVTGPFLMPLVYGKAFAPATNALIALVPGLIGYTMEGAIGYYLTVQLGRPLLRLGIKMFSVVLCALISIVLLPHYGIVGAAIATSVSYLAVIAISCAMFVRHAQVPVRDLFILRGAEIVRIKHTLLERLLKKPRHQSHMEASSKS